MGLTLLRVRRDSAECARSVRGERSGLGRRMQENARGVRRGCKEAASRGREDQDGGCRSGRRRDGDPGVPPPGQEAPGARSSPLPARVTLGARPAGVMLQGVPAVLLCSSAAARRGRDERRPRRLGLLPPSCGDRTAEGFSE